MRNFKDCILNIQLLFLYDPFSLHDFVLTVLPVTSISMFFNHFLLPFFTLHEVVMIGPRLQI